jgi:phage baseplate assembly protein W
VARAADLTTALEPAKAEGKPFDAKYPDAKPLGPGRAARAVVSDGPAVHDAIEAVLTAPAGSREVARRAYLAVRGQLVAAELDATSADRLRELVRDGSRRREPCAG